MPRDAENASIGVQDSHGGVHNEPTEGVTARRDESNDGIPAASKPASTNLAVLHPLECAWTMWYDRRPAAGRRVRGEKQQYESNLVAVASVATVESFWSYFNHLAPPSHLENNANYHFFRDGIKPMWEDTSNANGGKWVLVLKSDKGHLDQYWEELLLALIGETLDTYDDVAGAVMSKRKNGDRISVWTRTKDDREKCMGIGRRFREILNIPSRVSITYQYHTDSMRSGASYSNNDRLKL